MDSEELAHNIRLDVLEMIHLAKSSHIGSALSVTDIVAVLYSDFVDVEQLKNQDKERTRIVLSKGHAGSAVYAALAEIGVISKDELKTYSQNSSRLSGHISHEVPGIEISTGSLGQGVSIAAGFAFAAKKDNFNYRTFAIVGDGECDEGSVWETALFAHTQKLNNFTIIVDRNNFQGMGDTKKVLDLMDLGKKFKTFGFNVQNVDGHNHAELKKALSLMDSENPTCVIAHTIKGKGVSFMENNNLWHYRDPQGEFYEKAAKELEMRCS